MEDLKVNIDGKEYSVKVEKLESGKLKVFFAFQFFFKYFPRIPFFSQ